MRKLKIILPMVLFVYLSIGVYFFLSAYSADEWTGPTIPTIMGYGYEQSTPSLPPELWVGLYNPPINEAENPYVGAKICLVETSLTFPKDIMEVGSVNFTSNDANNYSNETGVINFKAVLDPCTTITGLDLFDATFKTKQLGKGTIHFTKSIVTGGADGTTVLTSGVYGDLPIEIISDEEWSGSYGPIDDPLPEVPADIPVPQVKPVTTSIKKSSATSSSSASSSAKTATKTENSAFKVPTLTKLEFGQNALLDKASQKSQGVVFTGTAEPSSKVYILIQSQTEIYTDTTSGADGVWTYTNDGWLEDGAHTITVWSEKDGKISKKFSSPFVVSSYAKDQIAIGDTYPDLKVDSAATAGLKIKKESKVESLMNNKFFWAYVACGIVLIVIIIVLVVKSRRKKNNSGGVSSGGTGDFPSLKNPQDPSHQIW